MTAPHIGNTGVNDEDPESGRIWVSGYVVRDPARRPSSLAVAAHARRRARRAGRRRHQRRRHPRADPAPARARRDAGRRLTSTDTDERSLLERVLATPADGRAPTWPARSPPPSRTSCRPSGEKRFTVAALDLGIKSDDAAPDGRARHRGARAARDRRRSSEVLATGADGVFLSNGPGDPATADHAVALTARPARPRRAAVRHLLRQPDPRPGARASAPTSCATATAASTSRCRTAPPARSRSPRTTTASPSTPRSTAPFDDAVRRGRGQPRLPQRRRRRGAALPRRAGLLGAVPPGGRGRPARRGVPVRPLRRAARGRPLMPRRDRHPQRPGHRLRADRHRPGLRVRLLRHPGLPGAARARACGSSWSTPTRRRS